MKKKIVVLCLAAAMSVGLISDYAPIATVYASEQSNGINTLIEEKSVRLRLGEYRNPDATIELDRSKEVKNIQFSNEEVCSFEKHNTDKWIIYLEPTAAGKTDCVVTYTDESQYIIHIETYVNIPVTNIEFKLKNPRIVETYFMRDWLGLNFQTYPLNADYSGLKYTSSNPDVLEIQSDMWAIHAKAPGDAVITATSLSNPEVSLDVPIKVEPLVRIDDLAVPENVDFTESMEQFIPIQFSPVAGNDYYLDRSSLSCYVDNTDVIRSVQISESSDGDIGVELSRLFEGETKVHVLFTSPVAPYKQIEKIINVNIQTESAPTVKLNKTYLELDKGTSEKLTYEINPSGDYDIQWSSATPWIATVDDKGNVKAVGYGTGEIRLSASSKTPGSFLGTTATCQVYVPTPEQPPITLPDPEKQKHVVLSDDALSLSVGDSKTITATVQNSSSNVVTWKSSNEKVATVKDGKITAKKNGISIITAKQDYAVAFCIVVVDEEEDIPDGWFTDPSTGSKLYYKNGEPLKSQWLRLDGIYYYLSDNGAALTGLNKIDGKIYYFNEKCEMSESKWEYINNTWYYFNKWGMGCFDCWYWIDGVCYLFDENGVMQTGWHEENGYHYWMNQWGGMVRNAWRYIDNSWYYFNNWGDRSENCWKKLGTKWYYFYKNGKMAADTWIGNWYVDKSGAWTKTK